jgi:peptidylamidoglycolate lyase
MAEKRRLWQRRSSRVFALSAGLIVVLLLALRGSRPTTALIETVAPAGSALYQIDAGWPEWPAGMEVGNGSGVALDSAGHLFFLHRAGHPYSESDLIQSATILELDPESGAVLNQWGAGILKSPHGLTIDRDDNVWVTDVMQNKVYKFSHAGQPLLTLGADYASGQDLCLQVRNELTNLPCTGDPALFARPTDVAIGLDGAIYVADGYRNSRVAVFNPDGSFRHSWGELGDLPGAFNLVHGIAIDQAGRVYVADRRNARIQVFDAAGGLLAVWNPAGLGRPFGVEAGPDGRIYVADGGDTIDQPGARPRSQVVALDQHGAIVDRWGWYGDSEDLTAHDLAVGADGSVYVATLGGRWLYRARPRRP